MSRLANGAGRGRKDILSANDANERELIGRAALLRRRAWWPRGSAALPFAICAVLYGEMV
jgi:hypothetical protein